MFRVDPCMCLSFLFPLSDINDCSDQCQNGGTCKVRFRRYQISPGLGGYSHAPFTTANCLPACMFVCLFLLRLQV